MAVLRCVAAHSLGLGTEDGLQHIMNYVWPNVFETSPHVHNAFIEATEGLRIGLGAGILLNYVLQGLFHAARKVRTVYWKVYNNLYIGMQDSLVAHYPTMPEEPNSKSSYIRSELNMFI
jgi:splicing factor 3B subunit 1